MNTKRTIEKWIADYGIFSKACLFAFLEGIEIGGHNTSYGLHVKTEGTITCFRLQSNLLAALVIECVSFDLWVVVLAHWTTMIL